MFLPVGCQHPKTFGENCVRKNGNAFYEARALAPFTPIRPARQCSRPARFACCASHDVYFRSRRAPRSGRGGRRFKSCHSDQLIKHLADPKKIAPTKVPEEGVVTLRASRRRAAVA